jgi:predicted metal-dependent enzyme (double-stranded beta helix superfamily)
VACSLCVQPSNVSQLLSQEQLAAEVRRLAGRPAEWVSRVRLDPEGRWYEQIHLEGGCYEIWLISWLPGQSTGFHDHGRANGAFSVVWGALDECVVSGATVPGGALSGGPVSGGPVSGGPVSGGPVSGGPVSGGLVSGGTAEPRPVARVTVRPVTQAVVRSFGPHYVHDVRNSSKDSVAVSIHAYSPPLSEMTRYDLTPGGLVASATESQVDW